VPIDLLLNLVREDAKSRAPVSVGSLQKSIQYAIGEDYSLSEVREMIEGLHALAPHGIWSNGGFVALQTSPANIKAEIAENLAELPQDTIGGAREALKG
jgi:hypothetical protein